ncbi:MAG: proton-conducting transporter membrane subunit [Chloroflexi bacterium]|nr:proton-conducting transporter membrane subunit [Chloroflexota bacterium]
MSAPFLWIFLPLILAGLLMLLRNQKVIALIACSFTFFLTLAAWVVPIDTAMILGNWSFKLTSSFEILGRRLVLGSADLSLLALIYGSVVVWFAVAPAVKAARRLTSLGLAITASLVAALAVEPFLYAALLIEMAVLLSIPLLSAPGQKPGKGLIRFLIFQTLAMPFILFSGWLLAGIDANPNDLGLVQQAAILIGLGFAFLLAVFPFYSWIPLLTEESSPYTVGFILWIFPTVALFFGLGFLDHYTWLRDIPILGSVLTTVGVLMVVSGGLLAAFQRHLGRIMGYAVIMETGFSILTISLGGTVGLNVFLMLFVPRTLSLVVWSLALTIMKGYSPRLILKDIKGQVRIWPFATSGLVLANLALAGMPLLAGFPPHQAIWEGLASTSLSVVIWVLIGNLSLFFSAVRVMLASASAPERAHWESRETGAQRILLAIGFLALLLLGLFPQWVLPLWTKLPVIFTHLGQ